MLFSASMNAIAFPLSRYLKRIGLSKTPTPNKEGLHEVHAGQAFSIPFENLDIHLGRTISLSPGTLISKLIDARRGGYCFELNGIFALALNSLGFRVQPLLARVIYGREEFGARTHQVLIVTVSGRKWLADCGFGGPGLRLPISIVPDQIQEQYGDRFRLRLDPKWGMVLQKEINRVFTELYVFNEEERTTDADIEMANHFTSTWQFSIFRLRRMCSLHGSWGRVTLSDMDLTIHRDGNSKKRTLQPGRQYMEAIEEHFGIRLNAAYEELASLNPAEDAKA